MDEITWETTHGDRVTVYPDHLRTPLADAARGQFEWRWHVKARNNRIVGQGEGHPRCVNAIRAALRHHPRIVDGEPRYELWSQS